MTLYVVNDQFDVEFDLSLQEKSSGKMLYDLATSKSGEVVAADYSPQAEKYWNSHKGNPIYKKGHYQHTTVVGKDGNYYVAKVTIKAIEKNTFKKKSGKGGKSR